MAIPFRSTRGGGFEAFESADGRYLVYSKSDEGPGIWRLDLRTGQEQPIPALAEAGALRHWVLATATNTVMGCAHPGGNVSPHRLSRGLLHQWWRSDKPEWEQRVCGK